MALGIPIVSTNAGGLVDLLSHNKTAKIVNTNDVTSMVNGIKSYLTFNQQIKEIVQNARESVETMYNKKNILESWFNLIDGIIINV